MLAGEGDRVIVMHLHTAARLAVGIVSGTPSCFCGDVGSLKLVTYQEHPRIYGSVSSGTDLLPMPTFPGVKESVFLPQGGNVLLMTL